MNKDELAIAPLRFTKYESPAVVGDGYNVTATVLSISIGEITIPIRAFGSNDSQESWGTYKEWEKLVRKLAAALDMYEALKKIASMEPGESYDEMCDIYEDCGTCYEMIAIARAAIQKARGGK